MTGALIGSSPAGVFCTGGVESGRRGELGAVEFESVSGSSKSSLEDLLAANARIAAIFFRFISAIMLETGLRSLVAVGADTLVVAGMTGSTTAATGAGLTLSSCFLAPSSRLFSRLVASFEYRMLRAQKACRAVSLTEGVLSPKRCFNISITPPMCSPLQA